MLLFFLFFCVYFATSSIEKETTCNAQTPPSQQKLNGVSISLNPQSAAVSTTNYYVNVQSQDAYDIKLSLNKHWSFHSVHNSTIIITIDGYTPFPDDDSDLLLVFSVGNVQYFSFILHLDSHSIRSRIYPSISSNNNFKNVSEWISDTVSIPQRWDRISNNNEWIVLNNWRDQALWPLKFIISNQPLQDLSSFTFYHNTTSSFATSYTFDSSFLGNKNMDIYMMGDSENEQYVISSFNIFYTNEAPTDSPTNTPTNIPTASPTTIPPTYSPSNSPSKSPLDIDTTLNIILFEDEDTNELNKQQQEEEEDEEAWEEEEEDVDDDHVVIFTVLISCAVFVVLIQICCLIRKRIKKKYFTTKICDTESECTSKINEHINQSIIENENKCINDENKNDNIRKDTSSVTEVTDTERFEYNLDGRRSQIINRTDIMNMNNELLSLRRAISETAAGKEQLQYYHEILGHFVYEGVSNKKKGVQLQRAHDDDVMSFADTVSTNVGVTTKDNDTPKYTDQSHESECGLMDAQTINQYWKNRVNFAIESTDDVDRSRLFV